MSVVETKVDPTEGRFVQQTQPKVQFTSDDGTAVIQVAPDNLTIHQLRPYDSWDHFKERILKYLSVYCATARPGSLASVVLRSVNLFLVIKMLLYLRSLECPYTKQDYHYTMPEIVKAYATIGNQVQLCQKYKAKK